MVVLEEMTERSPTGALLHEAFLRRGWTAARFVQEQCPRTRLHETWEETVQSFSINYRRETRRRLRNIAKAYEVDLEVVPSGSHVDPAMTEFIEMHQDRWLRAGYWGAFADPRRAAFHRDVAGRLSRRGWLLLAFLRANGERCAANYGFCFRGEVSTFLSGARENAHLWKYSPSRVLHAKSMQWAIENGGTVYDFMRGTEHYKYEFDASDVPNWSIVAYPRAPRSTAAKHRLDSASSTVRRRAQREAQVLLATGRRGGWLSSLVLKQVARSVRRGLGDLVRVLRGRSRLEADAE
jgi:CelD/BcsL family acetyltransferase involved in cellulose biosynthesis